MSFSKYQTLPGIILRLVRQHDTDLPVVPFVEDRKGGRAEEPGPEVLFVDAQDRACYVFHERLSLPDVGCASLCDERLKDHLLYSAAVPLSLPLVLICHAACVHALALAEAVVLDDIGVLIQSGIFPNGIILTVNIGRDHMIAKKRCIVFAKETVRK